METLNLCAFPGCPKPTRGQIPTTQAGRYCSGHQHQLRVGRVLAPLRPMAPYGSHPKCSVDGCERHRHSRGLCPVHYGQWRTAQGRPKLSPAASLRFHYDLTLEAYEAKLAEQDGVCAVCREACSSGKRLAVDHDHSTGAFRGLLCMRCNTALGLLRDEPRLFLAAVDYLRG